MALAKSPAERTVLRQRPLPAGMQQLLQVAAGASQRTLAEFAVQAGESEAEVVDAARFYVREILFHQGADAYRVLGVAHDASTDTIRAHYRLLQLWLHPDRHSSDWDAIFASRVNAAWGRLRSDARRRAYDQQNPPQHRQSVRADPLAVPRAIGFDAIAEDMRAARWRRRVPLLALFVVCSLLGLAAVRDALRDPGGPVGVDTAQGERAASPPGARIATARASDQATSGGRGSIAGHRIRGGDPCGVQHPIAASSAAR